jgi:aryl-alcohol dehydrogenase-like predicted oxidoreductase
MGVGCIPWSPLARGWLTGSRTRDGQLLTTRANNDAFGDSLYADGDFDVVDRVASVAKRRDLSPAQVALAWLLHRPGVTAPIVGATKLSHLEDAIASVEVSLSAEEMAELEEPYRPHAISGHR